MQRSSRDPIVICPEYFNGDSSIKSRLDLMFQIDCYNQWTLYFYESLKNMKKVFIFSLLSMIANYIHYLWPIDPVNSEWSHYFSDKVDFKCVTGITLTRHLHPNTIKHCFQISLGKGGANTKEFSGNRTFLKLGNDKLAIVERQCYLARIGNIER